MKKYFFWIMLVPITCSLHLKAQVVIHADPYSGCGSLDVTFTILPASAMDTISTISWDFGNGTTSSEFSPSVTYNKTGSYNVSALVNGTALISAPEPVRVFETPIPSFFYTDSTGAGDFSFIFRSTYPETDSLTYDYTWIFDDGTRDTGRSVLHTFTGPGNYTVKLISDLYGCKDSVSRNIQINDLLVLPNVFTPNGDGLNDYFRIRTNGVNIYSLSVYTRSGVLVFRSESPYIIWDGRTFSGQELHNGIYYFTVNQIDGENRIRTKGFVHLLR